MLLRRCEPNFAQHDAIAPENNAIMRKQTVSERSGSKSWDSSLSVAKRTANQG
jgi:hypothetical protein